MPTSDPLVQLIEDCRHRDAGSQEKLYRYCYPLMIRLCCRYAGDMDGAGTIFNNAMLKVFRFIPGYSHEGKFDAWLKKIVVNCCLDFVKKQCRYREIELTGGHAEDHSISEEVWGKISVKDIQEFIRELPRATAVVFNLFVYEGYTHKEIGQSLEISEGTSKWHVNEGRRLLKTRLEKFFHHSTSKHATGK